MPTFQLELGMAFPCFGQPSYGMEIEGGFFYA